VQAGQAYIIRAIRAENSNKPHGYVYVQAGKQTYIYGNPSKNSNKVGTGDLYKAGLKQLCLLLASGDNIESMCPAVTLQSFSGGQFFLWPVKSAQKPSAQFLLED